MKDKAVDLLKTYLKYYHERDNLDYWAWEKVDSWSKSADNFSKIIDLVQMCDNKSEIAYVAAGPLNDMFCKHFDSIKTPLYECVRQQESMRIAVQCLIFDKSSTEYQALIKLLDHFELEYASI